MVISDRRTSSGVRVIVDDALAVKPGSEAFRRLAETQNRIAHEILKRYAATHEAEGSTDG